MTTFVYPTNIIVPSAINFFPQSNTAVYRDPFSDYVQTSDREGERWIVSVSYNRLQGDNRPILLAFLTKLNGMEHRFTMQDYGHAQRGTAAGTPLVNGAGQTGKTLIIDGASFSITKWLEVGDRISVGSKMYQLDDDVNSDAGGNVTLTLSPRIITSHADDAAVEVITPVETLILENGTYSIQTTRNLISTLSFTAMGVPNE